MDSLTVKSVLSLLTYENQKELYGVLSERFGTKPLERVQELEQKYSELEFLNSHIGLIYDPNFQKLFDEIKNKYPEDYDKLISEKKEWHHGFNTGVLACANLMHAHVLPENYRVEYEDVFIDKTTEINMAEAELSL